MSDHDAIARAQAAIENGLIEALQSQAQADMDGTTVIVSRQACDEAAEFLPALYDEVKRLRAERDAGKRTVPAGQTPLDDKLNHRFLDVIREGEAARDAGTASPYHGHSLEHCLHATGWVSRDLRLALDEARARAEEAEAERDRLRVALTIYSQSGNWRLGGCCDPNSPNFTGEAIARQALKGHNQ